MFFSWFFFCYLRSRSLVTYSDGVLYLHHFSVRAAGISYENMFEELPVIIKNSHLGNVMLAELGLGDTKAAQSSSAHLELGTRRFLFQVFEPFYTIVVVLKVWRAESSFFRFTFLCFNFRCTFDYFLFSLECLILSIINFGNLRSFVVTGRWKSVYDR